ncbi:MAG: hypothetical protein QXS38_01180 [Candidatus Pacearchaeota archaeon]
MRRTPERTRAYRLEGKLVSEITKRDIVYFIASGPREAFGKLFSLNPKHPDNRCGEVKITEVSLDNIQSIGYR